jgi:hypothetical protein
VIAVEAPELLCFRDSLANFDEYPPLFTISNSLEPAMLLLLPATLPAKQTAHHRMLAGVGSIWAQAHAI